MAELTGGGGLAAGGGGLYVGGGGGGYVGGGGLSACIRKSMRDESLSQCMNEKTGFSWAV